MSADYTLGVRVHSPVRMHITLAYLGALTEQQIEEHKKRLEALIINHGNLPLGFLATHEDWFGPENKDHVMRCELVPEKANQQRDWIEYYQKHGIVPPSMPARPAEPNYHITMKEAATKEWVLKHVKEHPTVPFRSRAIFIKQLGPHDPVWQHTF
jgi:2'-5' RNA ligase